jgi:hypothetical protein
MLLLQIQKRRMSCRALLENSEVKLGKGYSLDK